MAKEGAKVRINSVVDGDLLRRLRHVLLDERIGFSAWLRRQIESYLAEKEPGRKKKPRKEA
jgi:hypothetical protein